MASAEMPDAEPPLTFDAPWDSHTNHLLWREYNAILTPSILPFWPSGSNHEDDLNNARCSPITLPLTPFELNYEDDQNSTLDSNPDDKASPEQPAPQTIQSGLVPINTVLDADPQAPRTEGASYIRTSRTQTHSCDQCRASKRACDLRWTVGTKDKLPSSPCGTCLTRGLKCTTTWLSSRQAERQARKRLGRSSVSHERNATSEAGVATDKQRSLQGSLYAMATCVSAPEANLVRQLTSRETCSLQFNLYVDVIDMPVSQCLLQGSMPPAYSLGVAALTPVSNSLHLRGHWERATSWVKTCWETNATSWTSTASAPYVFHTASVLDALFQRRDAHMSQASAAKHDASITQTYKWVAIATATQFVVHRVDGKGEHRLDSSASLPYSRDIAYAAWRHAKQTVFGNISATTSFRLAVSLLLFGQIVPPPEQDDESCAYEEDSAYARCEGIRRIHQLCAQARALLLESESNAPKPTAGPRHPAQMLPLEGKKHLLELIGALEWLATIANATAIAMSRGKICPLPTENTLLNLDNFTKETDQVQQLKLSPLSGTHADEPEIDNAIVLRAKTEEMNVVTMWNRGPPTMFQAVRKAGSFVVLLYKAVASLTVVARDFREGKVNCNVIKRSCTAARTVMELWRSCFGILDTTLTRRLEESHTDLRRLFFFCSNDADLAILLLYEVIRNLESLVSRQPSTPAVESLIDDLRSMRPFYAEQRLLSAVNISMFALTNKNISSPGLQGTSGLKAHIQDIGAHPYPPIMVYAHTLAAKAFAEEIAASIARFDMKRASALDMSLETCLEGLKMLEQCLVTFPSVLNFDDEVTESTVSRFAG
ncbi:uncharacterized protein Z520_05931 [Fonsecaea multimorphosa CBS 102226]|uniref:Zn(2)-C6 fungal-type domain-containing protein n=1 Tax=Fonsecaea multimorphosa CBS 102226 TaxID=1442371 RepID=A0A0D2H9S1_9EURO|nr:uncharacterized protein Z520_05931 [Fonsecaea multimorphosa CBS 102226]KIX98630.1 hypothetical protein Z520_05931 [Fonsecaea multimorphosa CBS 102226]OAL24819.1 hypothetical protein AYO22_05608 [Fonsecaea multimorphosa]